MSQSVQTFQRWCTAVLVVVLTVIILRPDGARGGVVASGNTTFTDDELVDSKYSYRPDGGCAAEGCQAHCRQKQHAAGRCDQEQCTCRDLKHKGRCALLGLGCGCDGCNIPIVINPPSNNVNNNNNNNVIQINKGGKSSNGPAVE